MDAKEIVDEVQESAEKIAVPVANSFFTNLFNYLSKIKILKCCCGCVIEN